MLAIGDKVITVTDDEANGLTGVIDWIWEDGYSVHLDVEPGGHWFGFDEVQMEES
ncbi:hypothetical protein [Streptomyces sp. WG5]|uniref:hypothetical protein n=1 Tax=Streptomyces sp. WG5 TaxID=3417648 RepID=UPI003CF78785